LPHDEKGLEQRPEADNLVGIHAALAGKSKAEVLNEFGGAQFSTFKTALVDLAVAKLGPINSEMKRLIADPVYIDSMLADAASRRTPGKRPRTSWDSCAADTKLEPTGCNCLAARGLVPPPKGVARFSGFATPPATGSVFRRSRFALKNRVTTII